MATRSNLLFRSGILIGLGVGSYIGLALFVVTIISSLHHMFIIGVQWTSPGFLLMIALPTFLTGAGIYTFPRAQRIND